jgi:acyl-CoA synthetase (AMP-forming)/AMP-acid ligase II
MTIHQRHDLRPPRANSELVVGDVARNAARTDPTKIAVQDGNIRLSYAELNDAVDRIASALVGLGIKKTDVVSAYLPNCLAYVLIVLAVARTGAIFSPINPRFKSREVGDIVEVSRPSLIFTTAARFPDVREAFTRTRHDAILVSVDRDVEGRLTLAQFQKADKRPLPEILDEDFFSLMFTSGTSGKPKGALATHRARMLWVLNAAILYELKRSDIYLGTMPQVHSAGLTFCLMHLYVGATVHILPDFDACEYMALVEGERVTSSLMVPTMLVMILEEIGSGGRVWDLSSLRRLVTCGSPLAPSTKEKILNSITDQLYDYYGATECNSISVLLPRDQRRKPTSVGQPFINVEVRILDDQERELSAGETGQIWCKNPSSMTCYLGQPDATASALKNGWYRTGDLGYLDAEGFLYLIGRSGDVIISGAVNFYPAEIEQVLMEHPGVLDCAVSGEPDPKWGQSIVAFIVPRRGYKPDLQNVQAHCTASLADYKKPRRVVLLDEIPKNAGGKTIRSALATLIPEGRA